jgi:hypothetical protein
MFSKIYGSVNTGWCIPTLDLCHSANTPFCQCRSDNWQKVSDLLPISRVALWRSANYSIFCQLTVCYRHLCQLQKIGHGNLRITSVNIISMFTPSRSASASASHSPLNSPSRHAANYNTLLPISRNFVTLCKFFELAERVYTLTTRIKHKYKNGSWFLGTTKNYRIRFSPLRRGLSHILKFGDGSQFPVGDIACPLDMRMPRTRTYTLWRLINCAANIFGHPKSKTKNRTISLNQFIIRFYYANKDKCLFHFKTVQSKFL